MPVELATGHLVKPKLTSTLPLEVRKIGKFSKQNNNKIRCTK